MVIYLISFFSEAFQKKYDLDIGTLLIDAKTVYEAAKVLNKEQKNIRKKRNKEKSKKLEKCMETYDENLATLEEAYKKIGPVCILTYI